MCGMLALLACTSATTSNGDGAPLGAPVEASTCMYPLVTLQTGPSSDCSGQSAHKWPVGMAATDCHGWQAIDTSGKQHNNSANQIRCTSDGGFTLTQFAGVLDCSGTGVVKTYALNVCTQDTPPSLYTQAVDLSCCNTATAAACAKGLPSVGVDGASVYLNNQKCGL